MINYRYFIFAYTVSYTTYILAEFATVFGVWIGIFMPIISNLLTIKKALSKKIRESLDIFHNNVNDTVVTVVKLEQFGISLFELFLGLGLTLIGFMTYYLAPTAFLYNKLEIFFLIINIILIGMIIGLCFIWFLIFPYIQTAIVYIIWFLMKHDRKLRPLILKNMNHSHKKRNAKTSILFTISLAYLIFGGSSLLLIGNLILRTVQNFVGTDLYVSASLSSQYLPEKELREFLTKESGQDHSIIYDYSFRGASFTELISNKFGSDSNQRIFSSSECIYKNVNISPVEINYLNATLLDFYMPKYEQEGLHYPQIDHKNDLIWSLYSDEGTTEFGGSTDKYYVISKNLTKQADKIDSAYDTTQQIKVLLPEGIKSVLSIYGGDTAKLRMISHYNHQTTYWRLLIRGLPTKVPGFPFLSYKQVQFFLRGIISFDQAKVLFEYMVNTSKNPTALEHYQNHIDEFNGKSNDTYFYPKRSWMIRLTNGVSEDKRDILS